MVVMETKSPIYLYNGENDVSTFSLSFFFIRSSSNLQISGIGIKSQTSSNSGPIGPFTVLLHALEHLDLYWENDASLR